MWSLHSCLAFAIGLRLILILYSRIHDYMLHVPFTDVDYSVFTDAAIKIHEGQSPFDVKTYRYTPLISILLLPTVRWNEFGKLLFNLFDIFNGLLIYQICRKCLKRNEQSSTSACALWLFNPFTAIISSRGNAESIVVFSVLLTLYLILNGNLYVAAIIHGGLAVHLKIYPLIYVPSIFIHVISSKICYSDIKTALYALICNWRGFVYSIICCVTFSISVYIFYLLYGMQYVNQGLLFHFGRFDAKHNFSPYFYVFYLSLSEYRTVIPFISAFAFVPQIIAILVIALKYAEQDLAFCWFLTTFAFVSLNKVSTSQYFIWYLCLIPLIRTEVWKNLGETKVKRLLFVWLFGQGVWLFFAYLFEFQGLNVLIFVWLSSILFLIINFYILISFMTAYSKVHCETSAIIDNCQPLKTTSITHVIRRNVHRKQRID